MKCNFLQLLLYRFNLIPNHLLFKFLYILIVFNLINSKLEKPSIEYFNCLILLLNSLKSSNNNSIYVGGVYLIL